MDKKQFNEICEKKPFTPLGDIICDMILQDILSFRLNPGDRVSESRIAEELGVSRSPVKTALIWLEGNRFIQSKNSRYYVVEFNEKEYKDICDFIMMVEPFAAALAAEKINAKQLANLYLIAENLKKQYIDSISLGKNFEFSKLLENEMTFHSSVVKASSNRLIVQAYEKAKYSTWRYRGYLLYCRPEGFHETIDTDHLLICDMLKLKNPELAEAAVRRHLSIARNGNTKFNLICNPLKYQMNEAK